MNIAAGNTIPILDNVFVTVPAFPDDKIFVSIGSLSASPSAAVSSPFTPPEGRMITEFEESFFAYGSS